MSEFRWRIWIIAWAWDDTLDTRQRCYRMGERHYEIWRPIFRTRLWLRTRRRLHHGRYWEAIR